MKTVEELARAIPDSCSHNEWEGPEGDNNCVWCKEDGISLHLLLAERMDFIKQVKLDAIKEGMRRAAAVVVENNQPVFDLPTRLHTRQALGKAILTAAEQLTIKDL